MTPSDTSPGDRRTFIGRVTATAAMLAASGSIARIDAQQSAPAPQGTWDMSWVDKLTSRTRIVVDSPEISNGDGVMYALTVPQGYRDVYGAAADVQMVIVMRAAGVRLAFDDTIWTKYALNDQLKVTGSANPVSRTLPMLRDRGCILLACNLAMTYYAREMATRANADPATVVAEVRAHLIPGVVLMPSGVFAVARAQEAGCHLLRSS